MTDFTKPPTAETVRAARLQYDLTQAEAAALVRSSRRAWQDWEGGQRTMPPGLWELFCIKTARRVKREA